MLVQCWFAKGLHNLVYIFLKLQHAAKVEPPQEDLVVEPAAATAVAVATGAAQTVKLPQFWPQVSVGRFAQAECVFHTKLMTDSFDKYFHLVAVLPTNTVGLVMDLIEVTTAQQLYCMRL
jgi:hypothetical protein